MKSSNMRTAELLVKSATVGGFIGMVTVGMVLWADVSAIRTMLNASGDSTLASLFLAGAMTKGAVLGAAIGTAIPALIRTLRWATGRRPSQQDR